MHMYIYSHGQTVQTVQTVLVLWRLEAKYRHDLKFAL